MALGALGEFTADEHQLLNAIGLTDPWCFRSLFEGVEDIGGALSELGLPNSEDFQNRILAAVAQAERATALRRRVAAGASGVGLHALGRELLR